MLKNTLKTVYFFCESIYKLIIIIYNINKYAYKHIC